MGRPCLTSAALLLLTMCGTQAAMADTYVFQEGFEVLKNGVGTGVIYAGTHDTSINAGNPTEIMGAGFAFFLDSSPVSYHALVRFDDVFGAGPGQVPVGSGVLSATLDLFVYDAGQAVDYGAIDPSYPWDESTASWDTVLGGFGVNYGIDTTFIGQAIPGFVTDVQSTDVTASLAAWALAPAQNNGWGFTPGGDNFIGIWSSEGSAGSPDSRRPKLTVVTELDARLSLELPDCPDDADPVEPGYQIAVELWMRDLPAEATGFQAFLNYDTAALTYRGDLSTYSAGPFELHIQSTAGAEVVAGELRLDGSDSFGDPGESADSLLATLVFDVDVECSTTVPVTFDLGQPFVSELSFDGDPIDTTLADADSITLDDTAPVLDPCPDDIIQAADANDGDGCQGAFVTFTDPGASDNCDPAPVVVCIPASGSFFPVGTTTVTCTATDSCGNETMCAFDVTVTATNAVNVEVELAGVNLAVMRCIYFATDDCSFNNVTLDFIDHDGDDANANGIVDATEGGLDTPSTSVRAITTIEVPCGNWTSLCAKDEQHTMWATTSLTLGAAYTADTLLSLAPGDTDNDGDVDINDVTLLIAQFGNPALPGGCPWDGTRDSDFSNNGVVGSEDYSLLSGNWLMQSSCSCNEAFFGGVGRKDYATEIWTNQLPRQIGLRADLNRDGVINHRDVAMFERANGLSDVLSTKMLLAQQLRRP